MTEISYLNVTTHLAASSSLTDLCARMNEARRSAKIQEERSNDQSLRSSLDDAFVGLPTFGGEEPSDTSNVWSWDATHLIEQDVLGDGAFRVVAREQDKKTKMTTLTARILTESTTWTGWEWTHDPAVCRCGEEHERVVTEGMGAINDWSAWETERVQELRAEHTGECAASIAASEREYGEECAGSAAEAAEYAREAVAELQAGNADGAIVALEQAERIEARYGDSPTYRPLRRAAEALAEE